MAEPTESAVDPAYEPALWGCVIDGTRIARLAVAARDAAADADAAAATAAISGGQHADVAPVDGAPAVVAAALSVSASGGAPHASSATSLPRSASLTSPQWLSLLRAPSWWEAAGHGEAARRRLAAHLVDGDNVDSPQLTLREAELAVMLGAPAPDARDPQRLGALVAAALSQLPPPPPPTVAVDGVSFVLPEQFGVVEPGIFRSAFPTPAMFPFLDALRLRTVINLLDRLPPEYEAFLASAGVAYVHCAVKGNKATCEDMDRGIVRGALLRIMDARSHPVLIHCRRVRRAPGHWVARRPSRGARVAVAPQRLLRTPPPP